MILQNLPGLDQSPEKLIPEHSHITGAIREY